MKKLTLKTKEGCWRLLAIFIVIILLSGFVARMISSSGGSVKISRVTYDSRGATANADLYYPAGTSDKDSLPAVLVAHGGIAMLAMVGLVISAAALLVKNKFFVPCIGSNKPSPSIPFNKKRYWLFNGITVVVAFATMYYINGMNTRELLCNKIFPLSTSWWMTPIYLAVLGVMSGVFLVVEHASDKKRFGASNMASLNFNQKVPAIIKNIFLSIILVTIAYASLMVLEYLFNEDYRFWMASFQEMRAEHWSKVWIHALFMFPSFLLIGASVNYSVRTDIPEWKDTLITVVMNSLGVWLLCAINFILLKAGATSIFSDFKLTYGFVFFVPLTLYLTRKCYKITHNIWLGAALCSLMLTWALFPSQGYHSFSYMGQTWIGNFFNI